MSELFCNLEIKERIDTYLVTLSQNSDIKSINTLLSQLKADKPNDSSINYNRVQRDLKKFITEKKIDSNNSNSSSPIELLRNWYKKNYMPLSIQDFFCEKGITVQFDKPNIYIQTKPFEADRMGNIFRSSYGNSCPFIIVYYDTVLVRFINGEKFDEFKELYDSYLQTIPESED